MVLKNYDREVKPRTGAFEVDLYRCNGAPPKKANCYKKYLTDNYVKFPIYSKLKNG